MLVYSKMLLALIGMLISTYLIKADDVNIIMPFLAVLRRNSCLPTPRKVLPSVMKTVDWRWHALPFSEYLQKKTTVALVSRGRSSSALTSHAGQIQWSLCKMCSNIGRRECHMQLLWRCSDESAMINEHSTCDCHRPALFVEKRASSSRAMPLLCRCSRGAPSFKTC